MWFTRPPDLGRDEGPSQDQVEGPGTGEPFSVATTGACIQRSQARINPESLQLHSSVNFKQGLNRDLKIPRILNMA
jgi:hypothetical protein